MASSSAKALPVSSPRIASSRATSFQWPPHRPRHCRPLSGRFDDIGSWRVSMASSSAKALPACEMGQWGSQCPRFQWPPHRPRHCRAFMGQLYGFGVKFQWPPHRPRHCRHRGGEVLAIVLSFNGLLIGQGTAGPELRLTLASHGVSMASSSAKALPGGASGSDTARSSAGFQWPPHRPRHCRASPNDGLDQLELRFNGLLIGQGTAGQAVRGGMPYGYLQFQWPPHRPRHCRRASDQRATAQQVVGFNGLLIGQGTAGHGTRVGLCAVQ